MSDDGTTMGGALDLGRATKAVGMLVASPSPALVEATLQSLEWVHLKAGETLFERGEPSDAFYFVLRGRLRVTIPDSDGVPRVIRDLSKGEMIGEIGLINAQPRSATVKAVRDSALGRISARAFGELTAGFPEATIGIANALLRRSATGPEKTAIGSVTLFVASGDTSLASRLATAMAPFGGLEHVSRDQVETLLSSPGIADAPADSPEGVQVARALARAEDAAGRLLLEATTAKSRWTDRALRSADLVIIAVGAEPTDSEDAEVASVMESLAAMPHVDAWLVITHPAATERPVGTEALRRRYGANAVFHVLEDRAADLQRLARLASGEGVGLVLGGGGARGLAHFGVHRAAIELGIPVDHIGGSSIGGIVGAILAQDPEPDEMMTAAAKQFRKVIDYTLPVVSLAKGRKASRHLAARFGEWSFEDLWMPFFCMSTNLTRTASVVHDSGDIVTALRAGFSIPGVFPPTPIGEDLHVDAGVLNNLPVDVMRGRPGIGRVIAVDVAPPVGPSARSDYGLSVSGWGALRKSMGPKRSPYPGISAVLMRSMILASMQARDRVVATDAADLYLDLDLRGVSLLDFERVRQIADAGYEAAMPRLEAWLASQR